MPDNNDLALSMDCASVDGSHVINADSRYEDDDLEASRHDAETVATKVATKIFGSPIAITIIHLAEGGYHHVWLVESCVQPRKGRPTKFILRIPRRTPSLQPYQLRNQVACLKWLAIKLPSIPVPKLYDWDDGGSGDGDRGPAFTAEEFIDGQRLSVVWPTLTETEKFNVCEQIANVLADLGEMRFETIGSLTPSKAPEKLVDPAPTVEAAKLFNGRTKHHSQECYDIGPYSSSKDYILACYDREIHFYTNADATIIEDFFHTSSLCDYIAHLKRQKDEILTAGHGIFTKLDAEPRVLVHEDFHAGNMLVRDGQLVAVLDWEFSGVYPLNQLLGKAQVLQISMPHEDRTEETEQEEDHWHELYLGIFEEVVKERGWAEEDIKTVLGGGNAMLNTARMIMFPD